MIEEAIQKLTTLLNGELPESIGTEFITDESHYKLALLLNQVFTFMKEINEFIMPLSRGNLDQVKLPQPGNFLGSPFKEFHSRLLHLTWQARQVAKGDYNQRIDFMGDFSDAFNYMVESLDITEKALKIKIEELEAAISHISQLEDILPICANCKKIRSDVSDSKKKVSWVPVEAYISQKTPAKFSHSICPECMKELYGDFIKTEDDENG